MKVQNIHINIEGQKIPAKVYHEKRKASRASIGRKHVILRIPIRFGAAQQQQTFDWFVDWLKKTFKAKKELFQRFVGKTYKSGDVLTVGKRAYTLDIRLEERKHHSAKLKNGIISLHLNKNVEGTERSKAIRHLLSRLVAKDFKPTITQRVLALNQQFFQKPVKSVNLKYNLSNWGSCSSKGNVNLSTRLLFAPDSVIDYVIIHELAHLIEMNHSSKFWRLVKNAMPNYKDKERWLKENRQLCDF